MASIRVRLLSEFKKVLSEEEYFPLDVLDCPAISKAGQPMLGHVDPYGDTMFNRAQMRTLLDEIDALLAADALLTADQRRYLSFLRKLCVLGDAPHRYLWVWGA
ncbi:hypothetical protein ACWCOT_27850 [Nonomuraea bangladeshensis]